MSKINITSPIGNLMYVMISGQGKENYEGTGYDYQACVDIPDGKEADAFIDMIEDFVEANEVKGAKRTGAFYRTNEDDKTIPEGFVRFTFKTRTEFTDKKGNVKDTEVDILDAAGNRVKLPNGKLIGNDSTGRVIGTCVIWERGSSKNKEYGASLYLNKVQIKDFIPYEGSTVDAIEGGSFKGFDNELEPDTDEAPAEDTSRRRSRRR